MLADNNTIMEQDHLPMIIKIMREGLGINQDYLANVMDVDDSSLSKYESGSPQITRTTFLKIAKFLYLNDAYVEYGKGYPFKSNGNLIRLLIKGFLIPDVSIFFILIYYARQLEFVSLIPDLGSSSKKKRGHRDKGYPYAIAARDQGNYFLLRMRLSNVFIVPQFKGNFSASVSTLIAGFKKRNNVTFRDAYIGETFYERLKRWDMLTVNDIEPFFSGEYDARVDRVVNVMIEEEIPENLLEEVVRKYKDKLRK